MARSRLEPVAAKVEEALVGPVAGGQEEDEEENGAVDAGPVEEVGADEEEEDEGWGGVGGDEEKREPAVLMGVLAIVSLRIGWRGGMVGCTSVDKTCLCILLRCAGEREGSHD